MKCFPFVLFSLGMAFFCQAQATYLFQIQMDEPFAQGLIAAGDQILLRGSFNNWQGADLVLEDPDGDHLYTGAFPIPGDPGMVIEYKFVLKKPDGRELWEKNPNPENPPNGNRVLVIGEAPGELPVATFDFDRYSLALLGKPVVFSVKEMQEDLQFFRQTLEENHCCLYEYTDKPTFDRLFDEQYAKISEPMGPVAFYRILSPLTARVGCMHTGIWMAGGFWDIDPDHYFPLQVRFIQGQIVVSGWYTGKEQIPKGSILLGINGRPIFDVIGEMRANLSSDAFNPYFIDACIEKRFPMIYARMFGFPKAFELTYVLPDLKTRKTATLTPADIQSVRAVVFNNFQQPPLQVEYRHELSTALLTIPTFGYYDRVEYFRGFIDTVFWDIREHGIQNLVLDLRGNDGGDPFCSAALFAYLQPQPLPYFAEPYGKYAELAQPLPLPENHFTGKLYTLLDGHCGSTNGHFCSLLDYHSIGKFAGTPSGSTYTCNAGKNTEFRLPHSGMILLVGRSSFATAVKDMDKTQPILPDIPVMETIREFAEGKDACLEKVLNLIEHPEQ